MQSEALSLTTRDREEEPARSPERAATPIEQSPFTPEKTGKGVSVHCTVEAVWSVEDWERGRPGGGLEADSCVLIPVATAFSDLVPVALGRLGYSKENAAAAKGCVVIKNWKPLSLEQIAESPLMTVGDILGEISALATLKILIFRTRPNNALADMKDKLLKLLLVQSQHLLVSSGCPLDEIVGGSEPTDETRRKFDTWWSMQAARARGVPPPWYHPPPAHTEPPPPRQEQPKVKIEEHLHPAIQTVQNQYPTQKTRMRTSFDPELELPKLQRWFFENPHPTRQQIQHYVKELNCLESRRGRKPLDVNNVVYWFKNARAAQKRAEVRTMTPGLSHMSLNGYNSSSESPSDAVMSKSPGSQDEDLEDDDRPPSAPLSLTTRETGPLSSPSRASDRRPQSREDIKCEVQDDGPEIPTGENNNNINNNNNNTAKEEQDMSEEEEEELEEGGSEGEEKEEKKGVSGRSELVSRGGFPMVNSVFGHSMLYMGHYIHGLGPGPQAPPLNLSSLQDERRKRNRTFIDPVSEVPRLEQWFALNTHPSHNLILKYTDDLNRMPYRQKFPPLEPKNVQFWFKNRRAKCKRLKMSLFEHQGGPQPFHIPLSDPYNINASIQNH